MKIALVSPMLLPVPAVRGGAVEMLTKYLIYENEKKHKLDIDLYTIYDKKIDINKYKNTKIIQIKRNNAEKLFQKCINLKNRILKKKPKYNILYNKAVKVLKNKTYDKIIIENNMFMYNLICNNVNTELVYHMHNDFNNWDKTKENYKNIAQTASKILVVSNYLKNRVNSIKNTNKVEVLYNAVDNELYNEKNIINLRKKYNINNNDIVIGYSGRITKEKGILELIKAIKKIKTIKNIKLLIIGSQWYGDLKQDKYMEEIQMEMKDIKNRIVFTGYISQENMPSMYNTVDVLVVPSLCEEAFGCVAIEAMAMGKPLIVAKSGALSEIVKENFGYIIEKDSNFVDNMAKAIKKIVDNDDLRKKYGENAKKEFENSINYHKEEYYENFYNYIKN